MANTKSVWATGLLQDLSPPPPPKKSQAATSFPLDLFRASPPRVSHPPRPTPPTQPGPEQGPAACGPTEYFPLRNFVEEKMGSKFVEGRSLEFSKSYKESSPSTPIFFILSPGVDPLKDVEALGKHSCRSGALWKCGTNPQRETPNSHAYS